MVEEKKINQEEVNKQIRKFREFLFGFGDFVSAIDIALFSILYGLSELEKKDMSNVMLLNLLENVESQCKVFKSNIDELKRLLQ